MRFEWDERKNAANIRKHGLSFAVAEAVFAERVLYIPDERHDYGEERWIALGSLRMRIVVVVFTEPDKNTKRIISLRKATLHECIRYEEGY